MSQNKNKNLTPYISGLFVFTAVFIFLFNIFFIDHKTFTEDGRKIKLPKIYDDPLLVKIFDDVFSITPINAQESRIKKEGKNKFRYIDAYKNTDVVQVIESGKIKEDIVLKRPGHPFEFKYKIDLEKYDFSKNSKGDLIFYSKDQENNYLEKLFTIPAPFMIDDEGNKSSTDECDMSLNDEGELVITINQEWLSGAVYPVILDPTIEINILNVHSHPQQGDNWNVSFTTLGVADLRIIPVDQATIDDDEFVSLKCGEEERQPEILEGDVIFYKNWQCEKTAVVVHKTLKADEHTLRFEFGDQIAFAYNTPAAATKTAEKYQFASLMPDDVTSQYNSSPHVAFTSYNTGYLFYIGGGYARRNVQAEIFYIKTTDGGDTWGNPVSLGKTHMWENLAVWYDQWTPGDTSGTKIHIAIRESDTDQIWYHSLDTSSDTLDSSGLVAVTSTGAQYAFEDDGGANITKSTDGNLFIGCSGSFDGSNKMVVYKSTDSGDTWADTSYSAASGLDDNDKGQLLPLSSGDVLMIMQDITVNKVISIEYDEATDTWGNELTIDSSWTESGTYELTWGASLEKDTGNVYLAGNNYVANSTGDLETYKFTDSSRTWSTLTPVVSDNEYILQGTMAVDSDSGDLYVTYIDCSSLIVASACAIKYKKSTDDGSSWDDSVELNGYYDDIRSVFTSFTSDNKLMATWYNDDLNRVHYNIISTTTVSSPHVIDSYTQSSNDYLNSSPNLVYISSTTGYSFYVDYSTDAVFRKTTDRGHSWSQPTVLSPDKTWAGISVWYEQWTPGDTSGTKIHITGAEEATDDIWYYSLDTSDDSLDADGWVVIDSTGTSYGGGGDGAPGITRATDGALFAFGCGTYDGSAKCVVASSTDSGDTWGDTSYTASSGLDDQDYGQILPLSGGDALFIMQDITANKVISLEYDAATDSWGNELTIDSSWVENYWSLDNSWGASLYKTTGDVYLSGINALAGSSNDLESYKFTESSRTWSTLTEVVSNDDGLMQGITAVDSANGDLYVIYGRAGTDGLRYVRSNIYYKKSGDDGSTWSSEHRLTTFYDDNRNIRSSFMGDMTDDVIHINILNLDSVVILDKVISSTTPQQAEGDISKHVLTTESGYSANASPAAVFVSSNNGYVFYVGGSILLPFMNELVYQKTTDGGDTWGRPVSITGNKNWQNVTVWYDQWTPGDTSGTKIHIAGAEDLTDDLWYHSLDTSDDSLDGSGWVEAIPGSTYDIRYYGPPSITKSTDGYLFMSFHGQLPGDDFQMHKSIDSGDTWADTSMSVSGGLSSGDSSQIVPLSGGDILAIYQDVSANNVVSIEYDEATDTWGNELTIDASWVDNTSSRYRCPWGASLDKDSNNVYLAGDNYINDSTNDLEAYKFTDSSRTWSTLTPVVSDNISIAQGSMAIDSTNNILYVAYVDCLEGGFGGNNCTARYKYSTDDGVTWSSVVDLSSDTFDIAHVRTSFSAEERLWATWHDYDYDLVVGNTVDYSASIGENIIEVVYDADREPNASPNVAFISSTTGYIFFVENSTDAVYKKTTDSGATWGDKVVLSPDKSWGSIAVWYDQWTPGDTSGTKIHIAGAETVTDDLWYYSLDTDDDSLDADGWLVVDLGTSYDPTSRGGPSITKATDNALFISACGTYGEYVVVASSTDSGDTWADTSYTVASGLQYYDPLQLLPLAEGDILAISQDASEDKIVSLEYDAGTDAWTNEQTIDSSFEDNSSFDISWGASLYKTTGNIYLAGANYPGDSTNDIKTYKFTESSRTWSGLTDIVSNDSGVVKATMGIKSDNGSLYGVYITSKNGDYIYGRSDVYIVSSVDDGSTWDTPVKLSSYNGELIHVKTTLMEKDNLFVDWYEKGLNTIVGRSVNVGVQVNSKPTISTVTDAPDPINSGADVTFEVDWNDSDAEGIKLYVCKTDDISTTSPGCVGDTWCSDINDWDTDDPIDCSYTGQTTDAGSNNYYAFVCDDEVSCSTGSSGTFTVNAVPSIQSVSDAPDPINSGADVTFEVDWTDADSEGINLYVCKTDSVSTTTPGCVGDTWCSDSDDWDSTDPIDCDYTAQTTDAGSNNYYMFICDNEVSCSTSTTGTFLVNAVPSITSVSDSPDPSIEGQDITFEVDWNDADSEGIKLYVCKTDSVSTTTPGCVGDTWCSDSNDWDSTDPIDCDYTAQITDFGSNNYYTFVCDNQVSCSPSSAGAFTVNQKTFVAVSTLGELTSGLVGHWTFDGADMDWSSATEEVLDRSGNSNNGNAVNGPVSVIGKSGQGMEFDGVDDYVVGTIQELYQQDKTVTVWIKLDDYSEIRSFFSIGDTTDDGSPTTLLRVNLSGRLESYGIKDGGSYDYLESNETLLEDTWYLVTFINDTSDASYKLYINNLEVSYLVGTTGAYTDRANTANNYYIGVGYNNNNFKGKIDEVRIYNRALSSAEVEYLYQIGSRKLQISTGSGKYIINP
ncbi:MAG: hypothetical protein GY861_07555 [bacterium]|nr:hypothetical protein [bacterium]